VGPFARAALLGALAMACACSGCAFASYGGRNDLIGDRVPEFIVPGKSRTVEVLARLGEPDEMAISGASEVLFYKAMHGWHFGLVGRIVREDLVIRSENGLVVAAEARRIGASTGIGLPPFADAR
jgi:hypothetical protein